MGRLPKPRYITIVSIAAVTALLASACGSDSPSKEASDDKPFEGQTITMEALAAVPEFDFYKTLMPKFTEQTGIKVNYVLLPVSGMNQKVPLQLKAKDKGLDVFATGSENIGSFIGNAGVAPLDTYLNDTKQTPSSYNFEDIVPAVQSACQQGGKNYCVASHTGGALLYYNTKMFEEAGLTEPPQTPEQLYEYAKKLTTDEHAGFCIRGDKSEGLYDAFQLWNWFIPWDNRVTGNYFDKDWNFLIGAEPEASQFANYYRNLLQNTAPKGIATYIVTNCLQDFQQGRVAMWHDDSGTIPSVLDPTQSKVAEDTAFWAMPCQSVNPDHCALVQPFGMWMNNASTKKGAAWELIKFLTSAETQKAAVKAKALLTPSRNSVLQDSATAAALPETFPKALTYILAHPNITLLPYIPEGVAIIPPIANGLSELITTDKPVDGIMTDMTAGVNTIMKDAGYPKPFPSN